MISIPDPETASFRCSTMVANLECNIRTALVCGMVVAKRCVLKMWRSDSVPQFSKIIPKSLSCSASPPGF